MKKKLFIVTSILVITFTTLASCTNNEYSTTYNNDSGYRKNVKDIADTYDLTDKEVDAKLNAVIDAMNGK